jgi:hypothetical protein
VTPGYDLPSNLLYLLTILNNRWPADAPAPPAGLVDPDVWADAALGYHEFLDENLDYSSGQRAQRTMPGQSLLFLCGHTAVPWSATPRGLCERASGPVLATLPRSGGGYGVRRSTGHAEYQQEVPGGTA